MTAVSEKKGSEQNLDHRSMNLVVVRMLSICRTDLKGEIFVQAMVGMCCNGWETFLMLAVLPHGCQQIIDVAGSDRLYSVVPGIVEKNFLS